MKHNKITQYPQATSADEINHKGSVIIINSSTIIDIFDLAGTWKIEKPNISDLHVIILSSSMGSSTVKPNLLTKLGQK